jgi:hypothetical protein
MHAVSACSLYHLLTTSESQSLTVADNPLFKGPILYRIHHVRRRNISSDFLRDSSMSEIFDYSTVLYAQEKEKHSGSRHSLSASCSQPIIFCANSAEHVARRKKYFSRLDVQWTGGFR